MCDAVSAMIEQYEFNIADVAAVSGDTASDAAKCPRATAGCSQTEAFSATQR